MLLARSKAEHVNVMAYSCGSPLLASALARLRARHRELDREALQRRYRLGDVIFVASDVDLKTFARDHVQPALDLSRQVIVYFSTADRALGFSAMVAGVSRLGQPDISDLTVDELQRLGADPRFQAIDVTDVRGAHEMGGMKGHGYWYANEIISTDVTLALRYPIPPPSAVSLTRRAAASGTFRTTTSIAWRNACSSAIPNFDLKDQTEESK